MGKPVRNKLKLTILVGSISSALTALACFLVLTILAGGGGRLPMVTRILELKAMFIINFAAEVGLTAAVLTYKINRAGAVCIVGSAIGGYSALGSLIFSLACLPCGVLQFQRRYG